MAEPGAETTRDWQLPDSAKPPLIGELVERIDEALATARASEAAVMTVGAAALDAAEQARRAAELAERASAAIEAQRSAPRASAAPQASRGPVTGNADGEMESFAARADRVAERLQRLQRVPLSA